MPIFRAKPVEIEAYIIIEVFCHAFDDPGHREVEVLTMDDAEPRKTFIVNCHREPQIGDMVVVAGKNDICLCSSNVFHAKYYWVR